MGAVMEYDRAELVDVLVYHFPYPNASCLCGWAELGRAWADHVANVYEERLRNPLRSVPGTPKMKP